MDPGPPPQAGSPLRPARRSRVHPLLIAVGAIIVVCVLVGAAYVLALGPFQRASTAPPHGALSYSQAASVASSTSDSQGGGPWVVWSATAVQLPQAFDLGLSSIFDYGTNGCIANSSTITGLNSSVELPASQQNPSSGYFSFWFVQLGNASGWTRTILVVNGTGSIGLQAGPNPGCSVGSWLPTDAQLGSLVDSPQAVATAWNAGGSQFVAQHPNAYLGVTLPALVGLDTRWYWDVGWDTCPLSFGFHVANGTGELQTVFVNALNGSVEAASSETTSC